MSLINRIIITLKAFWMVKILQDFQGLPTTRWHELNFSWLEFHALHHCQSLDEETIALEVTNECVQPWRLKCQTLCENCCIFIFSCPITKGSCCLFSIPKWSLAMSKCEKWEQQQGDKIQTTFGHMMEKLSLRCKGKIVEGCCEDHNGIIIVFWRRSTQHLRRKTFKIMDRKRVPSSLVLTFCTWTSRTWRESRRINYDNSNWPESNKII